MIKRLLRLYEISPKFRTMVGDGLLGTFIIVLFVVIYKIMVR